jgi:chromosome segregation ATPase
MKPTSYLRLAIVIVAGALALPALAQDSSLGSYARTVRKDKQGQAPTAKKYDNDNLPKNDKLSIVGNATEEPAEKPAAAAPAADQAAASTEQKADAPPAANASADDQKKDDEKKNDEWAKKIAAQKDQIDLASRELDVLQREYRLRAATFYADAGDRLRNQASWDKQDAQYKDQIAQKQKALDAAKQQLTDMQEQARKAGVPSKARE